MSVTRRVSVERNRLRFAAAHMATFRGTCEPLHGHNYDIFLEIEGELDHKFLLQRESRHLRITELDDGWEVGFEERVYRFPKSDVAVLPIDNTTVERLSEWMAGQLAPVLRSIEGGKFRRLTVGLEEMPGQAGWYTVDL
jgi:6-pyruvoyltetrahydropterin/6-carboxytetrahydropterin synthase